MSEIEQLARQICVAIGSQRSVVPIDVALWDIAAIAEYLRRKETYTRDSIVTQPGFPRSIRLPAAGKSGQGRPLWRAKDVIAWAESFIQTH
ncbi:hypothetical protein [Chitinasiproducens palmae]|uniref:AlpA family phage regulatory protein n=1 Tax=Chitinasiproducens palmae TaxID=1770053 RepID=A0A1H2PQZ5_9BURK|nr:hypothetical protein [Chitinasiproducens palmae]SDV49255.1 hypothetical protein SAMN05216551_107188 [Chitinasiproducens palmae]